MEIDARRGVMGLCSAFGPGRADVGVWPRVIFYVIRVHEIYIEKKLVKISVFLAESG